MTMEGWERNVFVSSHCGTSGKKHTIESKANGSSQIWTRGCVIGRIMKCWDKMVNQCRSKRPSYILYPEEDRNKLPRKVDGDRTGYDVDGKQGLLPCRYDQIHPTNILYENNISPANEEYSSTFTRLASYRNWSPDSPMSSTRLVEAGFYCVNASTQTCKCFSCGYTIVVTEFEGKQPLDVHREMSPVCEFIRQLSPTHSLVSGLEQQAREADENITQLFEDSLNLSNHKQSNCDTSESSGNGKTDLAEDFGSSSFCRIDAMHGNRRLNRHVNTDSKPSLGNAFPQNGISSQRDTHQSKTSLSVRYPARNPEHISEQSRRETFMYWPHQGMVDVDVLVDAGFYFTGTDDIVRCFHCDIGLAEWNSQEDPWTEHARHSPQCPYLNQKKTQTFIDQIQRDWAKSYTPKRPDLIQLIARLKTFENSSWPYDMVVQTPHKIAEAGFYYIGEGDTVRCHYCDGGLREWEPNDDPWIEHARWFPFCKFVVKIKGIKFLQQAATGNGIAVNSSPAPPTLPSSYRPEGITMSFEDECRRKEQENPLLTAAAQSVEDMGYHQNQIRYAINTYICRTGKRNFTAVDLMDIILEKEDSGEKWLDYGNLCADDYSSQAKGNIHTDQTSNETIEPRPAALIKENEYLRMKILCIECKKEDRCMLFLPCGHRLLCESCSDRLSPKGCQRCGSRVHQTLKTFLV